MAQGDHPAAAALAERAAEAQKATWVSVAVNLLLTVAQLVVGWLAHSQSLVAHGLIEVTADAIDVTPLGRPFVRNVCMVFDRYLRAKATQERPVFSRTV